MTWTGRGGHGGDPLHLGHHGQAEGRRAHPRDLRRNCDATGSTLAGLCDDDVLLGALPLFHSFGQTCTMTPAS